MQPAGQDPEARPAPGTVTVPLCECQSFLDNVMAGLGQIGAWSDPATSTPRDFVAEWSYPICASSRQRLAAGSTARMEHQTTNLGVRSSNLSGRTNKLISKGTYR